MTFEFDLGEMRVTCSSLECIQKLVDKGARLSDPGRAEDLRRALEAAEPIWRLQSSHGRSLG